MAAPPPSVAQFESPDEIEPQFHEALQQADLERRRVITDDGPLQIRVLATNVHMKTGLGWRIVVHHASPAASRDVQDIAESASLLH